MRPIAVERQDENQTVVKSGVAPPERVVTTGFARLKEDSAVQISNGNPASAPAPKVGGQPNGRRLHKGGNGEPHEATQRNGGNRKPAPPQ